MVPRQSRETFRPVRPSRVCWMDTPPGLVQSAVVGLHVEGREPMVDVGVTDEEIESYSWTARRREHSTFLLGAWSRVNAGDLRRRQRFQRRCKQPASCEPARAGFLRVGDD